jgi:hypothetical protein
MPVCRSTSCNSSGKTFRRKSWQTAPVRRGGRTWGSRSLSSARPAFSLIVRGPSLGNQASECLCFYNISFMYSGADSPSVGLVMQFYFTLYMLSCKESGRTQAWMCYDNSLQIYVEGLGKCTMNLSTTNVMDEIRVKDPQIVMQEYQILNRDAHAKRSNLRLC